MRIRASGVVPKPPTSKPTRLQRWLLFVLGAALGGVLGYGYLEVEGDTAKHGFMAVARDARGHGVAGAVKRAQIAWAKAHRLRSLRAANEVRLTGMLALNQRHGYQPLYTELVLRGPVADETK